METKKIIDKQIEILENKVKFNSLCVKLLNQNRYNSVANLFAFYEFDRMAYLIKHIKENKTTLHDLFKKKLIDYIELNGLILTKYEFFEMCECLKVFKFVFEKFKVIKTLDKYYNNVSYNIKEVI